MSDRAGTGDRAPILPRAVCPRCAASYPDPEAWPADGRCSRCGEELRLAPGTPPRDESPSGGESRHAGDRRRSQ